MRLIRQKGEMKRTSEGQMVKPWEGGKKHIEGDKEKTNAQKEAACVDKQEVRSSWPGGSAWAGRS